MKHIKTKITALFAATVLLPASILSSQAVPLDAPTRNYPSWIINFLPPVEEVPSPFDETLLDSLSISVCKTASDGSCSNVITLTRSSQSNPLVLRKSLFYAADFQPPAYTIGSTLEFRVLVAGLHVGTFREPVKDYRTFPIRFRVENHPRVRAHVLHQQGLPSTEVAIKLVDEFDLDVITTILVLSWDYDSVALARAIHDVFRQDAHAAARILKTIGQTALPTAHALHEAYAQTPESTAQILQETGYGCIELGVAVVTAFGLPPAAGLSLLRGIGCGPDANCEYPPTASTADEAVVTKNLVRFLTGDLDILSPFGNWRRFDQSLGNFLLASVYDYSAAGQPVLVSQFRSADIDLQNNFYHLNLNADSSLLGHKLQISISVAGLDLGFIPLVPAIPGSVPLKFRIDNHPVIRARVLRTEGLQAIDIARLILAEFNTTAEESVRILQEEKFTPIEIGGALRTAYGADAQYVAGAFQQAGIPPSQTLEMLQGAFEQSRPEENAATMRAARYGAAEVWRAFEIVLKLRDEIIEDILINSGFLESEIIEALRPRLFLKYACLIDRSGPIRYTHPDEQYKPSSVAWFLARATLVAEAPGAVTNISGLTVSNLVQIADSVKSSIGSTNLWLDLDPEYRGGEADAADAVAYVHALRHKDIGTTDLQFWYFHPYNGPGTLQSALILDPGGFGCGGRVNTAPYGEHMGDWECVVLRFENVTNSLVEVYTSQHGKYPRTLASDSRLQWEQGHPVFYSSLNGHGNYVQEGENGLSQFCWRKEFSILGAELDVEVLNEASKSQIKQNSFKDYEFVAFDGQPETTAPWVAFKGTWGREYLHVSSDENDGRIFRDFVGSCNDMASTAICGIASAAVCGPFAIFCFFACEPLLDDLFDWIEGEVGPEAVGAFIGDERKSDPPPSPGNKGTEWFYFRYPNEDPVLNLSPADQVQGTASMTIAASHTVSEKVAHCSHCDGCGPSEDRQTSNISITNVWLNVDGLFLTNSQASPGKDIDTYAFTWDTRNYTNGVHLLRPRGFLADGRMFDYVESNVAVNNSGVVLRLELASNIVFEGDSALLTGTIASPNPGANMVELEWGDNTADQINVAGPSADGLWHFAVRHLYDTPRTPVGLLSIRAQVNQGGVVLGSSSVDVAVLDKPPHIERILGSQEPVPIGSAFSLVPYFSDPGLLDTHVATFAWGDGLTSVVSPATSPVSTSHTYLQQGVYMPSVTITDHTGAKAFANWRYAVTYRPGLRGGAGTGTILAPMCDGGTNCPSTNAQFGFVLDLESNTFVGRFKAAGFEMYASDFQSVSNYVNGVQVTGNASVNGNPSIAGRAYKYRINASQNPSTFKLLVSTTDASDVEHVYQTDDYQVVSSGRIFINP